MQVCPVFATIVDELVAGGKREGGVEWGGVLDRLRGRGGEGTGEGGKGRYSQGT